MTPDEMMVSLTEAVREVCESTPDAFLHSEDANEAWTDIAMRIVLACSRRNLVIIDKETHDKGVLARRSSTARVTYDIPDPQVGSKRS